jgi:hypothetical protein
VRVGQAKGFEAEKETIRHKRSNWLVAEVDVTTDLHTTCKSPSGSQPAHRKNHEEERLFRSRSHEVVDG